MYESLTEYCMIILITGTEICTFINVDMVTLHPDLSKPESMDWYGLLLE